MLLIKNLDLSQIIEKEVMVNQVMVNQVRQIWAKLLQLNCSNFKLKMCEMPSSYQNCQRS